jgi:hypothetical protein
MDNTSDLTEELQFRTKSLLDLCDAAEHLVETVENRQPETKALSAPKTNARGPSFREIADASWDLICRVGGGFDGAWNEAIAVASLHPPGTPQHAKWKMISDLLATKTIDFDAADAMDQEVGRDQKSHR